MDIKEIKHLAELSKLDFSESELKEFQTDFENLIELADTIKNANISGQRKIDILDMNELREDESKNSYSSDVLLKNAPDEKKGYFVVPRILE